MEQLDDQQLLAEFTRNGSDAAFAQIVTQHVNLVYSAAMRFTRNPHHAEEVSQAVFIILARKAGSLRQGTVLSGWLYQTARLTAANFMKGELRRQSREQKAYMQSILNEPDAQAWEQVGPLLEEAMGGLGETDRTAVVLRYFENKSAAEVAIALNLSQPTAQRRLNRAIEKLRKIFARRGIKLSTAVIAGLLASNSIQAAPAALAQTIPAIALAKGAAASASVVALANGVLKLMVWYKVKAAIAATAIFVLATSGVVYRQEIAHTILIANGQWAVVRHIAEPVDLSDVYKPNSAFDLDARFYAWKTVPRGFQVLHNIPLQIDGVFYLWGEANAVEKGEVFPEEVRGIEIHSSFETLYLYHNTFYAAAFGKSVYTVVFNYADGSSVTNNVRYGMDVLGWSDTPFKINVQPKSTNSVLAWAGGSTRSDKQGNPVRFYLTAINNPHPERKVETIDMYSSKSRASAAIFAMTTGKADLLK